MTGMISPSDWILIENIEILGKVLAWPGQVLTPQHVSKFGKLSSGHRTGKGQFSFQSQRKAMPKNAQTTTQLCSFHKLKILQARLQQYVNQELPDI